MIRKYYKLISIVAVVICAVIIVILIATDRKDTPVTNNQTTIVTSVSETTTTTTKPSSKKSESDNLLLLVNYNHKMDSSYKPDLVEIEDKNKIDRRAAKPLTEMLAAARKAGYTPYICSSYRTNEKQTKLFNRKVSEYRRKGYSLKNAEKLAVEWVAYPGTSEHQLGLAVDIVDKRFQTLDERQEQRPTQKWLMEHCWEYGFILRYPTSKKDITHINYEPWHYRYVGKKNAKKIKESGLCLEEYLEKNKKTS